VKIKFMAKRKIQSEEKRINDTLFYLCLCVTVIAIGMMGLSFFSRGQFPPTNISTFYIVVLLIYSLHKEALRWISKEGSDPQQRQGELFVYLWIVMTAILYLVDFLTNNYFSYSATGGQLTALSEITFTTVEVCAVFILTRAFKIFTLSFQGRKRRK
jgi:hypothetical protein